MVPANVSVWSLFGFCLVAQHDSRQASEIDYGRELLVRRGLLGLKNAAQAFLFLLDQIDGDIVRLAAETEVLRVDDIEYDRSTLMVKRMYILPIPQWVDGDRGRILLGDRSSPVSTLVTPRTRATDARVPESRR